MRSFVGKTVDEAVAIERSPLVEGFIAGLKAALVGAPVGAAATSLAGKGALPGALAGALIPGLVAGLAAAGNQKMENLNTEAVIRYHTENIKQREPMFFMPPRQYMGKYFSRRLKD